MALILGYVEDGPQCVVDAAHMQLHVMNLNHYKIMFIPTKVCLDTMLICKITFIHHLGRVLPSHKVCFRLPLRHILLHRELQQVWCKFWSESEFLHHRQQSRHPIPHNPSILHQLDENVNEYMSLKCLYKEIFPKIPKNWFS